jgi:hypothetical protein
MGRRDVVTGLPTLLVIPLAHAFFNAQTMSKEEMQQQILDAITSGKIQVTNINFGDHVEHQHKIEKVEAGGVGFQIFEASKMDLPRPKENDYNAVREYIEARKKKDPVFKEYCNSHQRKQLCERLSDEFGWLVDDHHLGVNIGRNK